VAFVCAFTPLRALIVGHPTGLHSTTGVQGSPSPTSSTTSPVAQATQPPRTVQPIVVPTKSPTHTPTKTITPTPIPPTPTPRPAPTPTPKPCPPTLLYGGTGAFGSSGTWVTTLQTKLNSLGITDSNGHKLDADGEYGPLTESAVKKYQTQQHLTVDGVVSAPTWRRLGYC
ncbi:MAG TPA: peptidoglycan-binding domain-containing protein, partial [Ktedonobacteraceae bacterium]|nr:peptidoglycan-binding domain-containing protein [Ktedonobacteraceae bacterium]